VKITIFGLWHLGCVTAAGLAELGYEIVSTDFDVKVVKDLSDGHPPIYEPGLEELLKKHILSLVKSCRSLALVSFDFGYRPLSA